MAVNAGQSDFQLAFHMDGGGLVATVTGRIEDVDALIAMFGRIAVELRRSEQKRLLVLDHTQGVVPPEHELRRLFAAMDGEGFVDVRIAYVDVRGTAVVRMEVAEILGRGFGYACRVFDNEQRARIWLSYGEH